MYLIRLSGPRGRSNCSGVSPLAHTAPVATRACRFDFKSTYWTAMRTFRAFSLATGSTITIAVCGYNHRVSQMA